MVPGRRGVERPHRGMVASDRRGHQGPGRADAVVEDQPEAGGHMGPMGPLGLGEIEAPKRGGRLFVVLLHEVTIYVKYIDLYNIHAAFYINSMEIYSNRLTL